MTTYVVLFISYTSYISFQLIILNSLIAIYAHFKYETTFAMYLDILLFVITFAFLVNSMFLFYIAFELMLLPIFYTIYYSGQTEDKVYTSYKFMYFTLFLSLLWLISIIYLLKINTIDIAIHFTYSLLFLLALLVKLPLPPLHLWLNDTHTSCPVSSSIILAGTVIKLSIYGLIVYYLSTFLNTLHYIQSFLLVNIVLGVVYTSLACIRQIDYKRYIAYTSVGHMNMALYGVITLNYVSVYGAFLLLLGHAFISASLFYHVNTLYERYHTKILYYYRGMSVIMPISTVLVILLHMFNYSLPPSITWFSEYLLLYPMIGIYRYTTYIISLIIVISMIYTIWIAFRLFFGTLNPYLNRGTDISVLTINITIYYIFLCISVIVLVHFI